MKRYCWYCIHAVDIVFFAVFLSKSWRSFCCAFMLLGKLFRLFTGLQGPKEMREIPLCCTGWSGKCTLFLPCENSWIGGLSGHRGYGLFRRSHDPKSRIYGFLLFTPRQICFFAIPYVWKQILYILIQFYLGENSCYKIIRYGKLWDN